MAITHTHQSHPDISSTILSGLYSQVGRPSMKSRQQFNT